MPYIAANPEHYIGKNVGARDSVSLVQYLTGAPSTATWRPGMRVATAHVGAIAKGTVIASMPHGGFPHDGHAAIFLGADVHGIHVIDQWFGQHAQERIIAAHGGSDARTSAELFYVVE
jgi:hypothetical protein